MKVVQAPRQSGKTAYIMSLSEQTKQPLVCFSQEEKKRVMDDARNRGVNIPEPVTLIEVTSGRAQGKTVMVDNLDLLLTFVFPGITIDTATITQESE
jgi:hypothetical protein